MAVPNQQEQRLVRELRVCCKDILLDDIRDISPGDFSLVRWIRAEDHNLIRAEQQLRESKEWRKTQKINNILDKGLDPYFKINCPIHLGIIDTKRRPVVLIPLGLWNLKKAVRPDSISRFTTYILQYMEVLMIYMEYQDSMRKHFSLPVSQFTCLVDFHGFKLTQLLDIKVLLQIHTLFSTLKSNYPETLAKCLCLNCPAVLGKTLKVLMMTLVSKHNLSGKVLFFQEQEQEQFIMKLNASMWKEEVNECLEVLALFRSSFGAEIFMDEMEPRDENGNYY